MAASLLALVSLLTASPLSSTPLGDGASPLAVLALAAAPDGDAWLVTTSRGVHSLVHIDPDGRAHAERCPQEMQDGRALTGGAVALAEGALWVAVNDRLGLRRPDGRWSTLAVGKADVTSAALVPLANGPVLFVARSTLKAETFIVREGPDLVVERRLPSDGLGDVVPDGRGGAWALARPWAKDAGVLHWDGQRWVRLGDLVERLAFAEGDRTVVGVDRDGALRRFTRKGSGLLAPAAAIGQIGQAADDLPTAAARDPANGGVLGVRWRDNELSLRRLEGPGSPGEESALIPSWDGRSWEPYGATVAVNGGVVWAWNARLVVRRSGEGWRVFPDGAIERQAIADRRQSRREAVTAVGSGLVGATLVLGTAALLARPHFDRPPGEMVAKTAAGAALATPAALVPLLVLEELGHGHGLGMGAVGLVMVGVPSLVIQPFLAGLGTWGTGQLFHGGSDRPGMAYLGAVGGAAVGEIVGLGVDALLRQLPRSWEDGTRILRWTLAIGLTGLGASMGHEWAGGARRP